MYPTNFSRFGNENSRTQIVVYFTIKVHSTGTVRVDFLYHEVQILGGEFVVQFFQDLSQNCGCDVAITCTQSCKSL